MYSPALKFPLRRTLRAPEIIAPLKTTIVSAQALKMRKSSTAKSCSTRTRCSAELRTKDGVSCVWGYADTHFGGHKVWKLPSPSFENVKCKFLEDRFQKSTGQDKAF